MQYVSQTCWILFEDQILVNRNSSTWYITGEEKLPSDQSRTIEQASLQIPLLERHLKNKQKRMEEQGKKQTDAITNKKKKTLEALTNKDDH